MQTPNENKFRVVILSDSHLKGCTKRINHYLSDTFLTFGWVSRRIIRHTNSGLGELEET
jgi:hypothetical protein